MKTNFFTKNIWLKLASFILAVALWFFVVLSGRSGIFLDIPIMYINVPQGFEVVDFPKTVSVNIEGQERLLKNLKENEVNVVIDLSRIKPGKSFYTLTRENFNLPRTLEITNIDPQTISLTIERQMKKAVPVQPAVVGVPERGFVIFEIKVLPEEITIEGPRSVVSKIYNLKTEPIDITGLNSNLQYKAKISLPANIRVNEQKIDVNVFVKHIR